MKPDLIGGFPYNGENITTEWFDLIGKSVPALPFSTVKIIAKFRGKCVMVFDEKWSLPGGHYETYDKNIERTIYREFNEETGGEIIDWRPLGYQKCIDPRGEVDYQLRVFATSSGVQKDVDDPGGGITQTKLVDFDDTLAELGWSDKVGKRIFDLARKEFSAER